MNAPQKDKLTDRAERIAHLEAQWNARFIEQPKLPTSALLTGATAMACGFGAVMFLAFGVVQHFQQPYLNLLIVFGALSLTLGFVNRFLANRWYTSVVVPWSDDRKKAADELEALKKESAG